MTRRSHTASPSQPRASARPEPWRAWRELTGGRASERLWHRRGSGPPDGCYPRWRRTFYPEGLTHARRARVPRVAARLGRAQRLVLLAAATRVLSELVRGDAAGVRLRGEGLALHHAHEEAARSRRSRSRTSSPRASSRSTTSSDRSSGSCRRTSASIRERLRAFFRALPRDTRAAVKVAQEARSTR